MATTDCLHDAESDSHVQITMLDGDCEDQTADEHHYGVVHVTGARIRRAQYTQRRKHHHRYQRCHCHRKAIGHPVAGHQQHYERASDLLWRLSDYQEKLCVIIWIASSKIEIQMTIKFAEFLFILKIKRKTIPSSRKSRERATEIISIRARRQSSSKSWESGPSVSGSG